MNRRERSWWYLFELFVVFLGVTLAFMLDRWGENHRLRSQEREYLEGLHRDVVADSSNLAELLDFYRRKLSDLEKIQNWLAAKSNLDSAEMLVSTTLFSQLFFKPSNTTWESMKAGGDLKLIRDVRLRVALTRLDKRYYGLAIHEGFIERFLWQTLLPFALDRMDLRHMRFFRRSSLLEPRFANLVRAYEMIIRDYQSSLERALDYCLEVRSMIRSQLE